MKPFLKRYKTLLLIKKIVCYLWFLLSFALLILIIFLAAYQYETVVIFSSIAILLAWLIPFLVVFYVPNFYPTKCKNIRFFISFQIYVLKDEKAIKKYRNNYVWQKQLMVWDKQLLVFSNDIESWYKSWYFLK